MTDRNRYEDRILDAACKQFSALGYYGSRVDAIALTANLNKRMVYEYSHTKEGLYLAVLSNVSNKLLSILHEALPKDATYHNLVDVYQKALDVLDYYEEFTRLWTWEVMTPTIHGPRILETSHAIFEHIKEIIVKNAHIANGSPISDETFDLIKSMIHSHLLTCAMYTGGSNDSDEETDISAHKLKCKSLVQTNRKLLLDAISEQLAK